MWRVHKATELAQASGPVEGGYEKVIPFRQLEFKNAFLEWVILDGVKQRKAASKRLQRAFKIANSQAAEAIPLNHSTIGSWIHDMFNYFEPQLIEEASKAKSRISISFDGWGSKHEKLSVVGVVAHFINEKYEPVTRLLGLPRLPKHGKTGVGMYYFVPIYLCNALIKYTDFLSRPGLCYPTSTHAFRHQHIKPRLVCP
jgi:hypothetical protein